MNISIQQSFHTCHDSVSIDVSRNNPADGSNAALMDANCHKIQHKKKKMGQDLMYVYAAEEISHFLEHGGCPVPMFLEWQVIIFSSIQKLRVQICHECSSLVIGSLAPW